MKQQNLASQLKNTLGDILYQLCESQNNTDLHNVRNLCFDARKLCDALIGLDQTTDDIWINKCYESTGKE